ncbi:SIR2-like domain-containing protein [Nitrosospira sp. Nsp18]|uniref:SIR2 family NAD-dependent protein deacylase n=1 Tax=Nitrosospira sp. Nsp18 TaxID=1855334 RepID=UPI0008830E6C|nr:SIR2 family protein [Nitrosospira sp. Nsp18]SDA28828.1 SIR2-like domain-containing protein [Nitrosospira sp. Nsp18]
MHQIIFDLDSRIVITTNFDRIYEKLCLSASTEGFKVLPYYSSSLGDELRSDTRLIIKAHGTIDEVGKMVFTKSEYHNAAASHAPFYTMVRALLLTNTCIFIGCSLDDPDVLLLLEDVRITASTQRPHYALILEENGDRYSRQDWLSSYNVKTLDYGPTHDALMDDLSTLLDEVVELRKTRPET